VSYEYHKTRSKREYEGNPDIANGFIPGQGAGEAKPLSSGETAVWIAGDPALKDYKGRLEKAKLKEKEKSKK
jgi:hypothetical protein